jgi:hypothetical protein
MRFIVVNNNCQDIALANCMKIMFDVNMVSLVAKADAASPEFGPDDVVICQEQYFVDSWRERACRPLLWPTVTFSGFHADLVLMKSGLVSPMGAFHSSICLAAFLQGLSAEEAVSLFRRDVFEKLGFFLYYDSARKALRSKLDEYGFPGDVLVDRWLSKGIFVHHNVHPKMHVFADLAHEIGGRIGLRPKIARPDRFLADFFFTHGAVWPVYPPVAEFLGKEKTEYVFKGPAPDPRNVPHLFDLDGLVRASFDVYGRVQPSELKAAAPDRVKSALYQELTNLARVAPRVSVQSPYKRLADHQFWRRAVERVEPSEVDPVVSGQFKISKSDKVATAGSCFAQHISRTLADVGFNYYVAEHAPPGVSPEEALARNYNVFSARFGNVYTAAQLLQLFERAFEAVDYGESVWRRADGRIVDPFRPAIEPDGFLSQAEMHASRTEHLACVKRMFASLDVFVFTMGLTEGWRTKGRGAIVPLAPGVVASPDSDEDYEFVNFGVADTITQMATFVEKLRKVNRAAKIVLTVSPVPLVATYEKRHVLASTTYSKSVLRAAASEVASCFDDVAYFPSYEVITGAFNRGQYFEADLRSVTKEGVDHVMRLFLKHYATVDAKQQSTPREITSVMADEIKAASELVCEEIYLDA